VNVAGALGVVIVIRDSDASVAERYQKSYVSNKVGDEEPCPVSLLARSLPEKLSGGRHRFARNAHPEIQLRAERRIAKIVDVRDFHRF